MEKFQDFYIYTSRGIEKWNVIDKIIHYGETYLLLEHDTYGDEVPYIIMDGNNIVLEWNWFDTLEDFVNDIDPIILDYFD